MTQVTPHPRQGDSSSPREPSALRACEFIVWWLPPSGGSYARALIFRLKPEATQSIYSEALRPEPPTGPRYPVGRAIIRCLSRPFPGVSTSTTMAKRCEICGKGPVVGRNVSHAHNVTPRRFEPNLQKVRALVNGGIRRLRVCTRCLRSNKVVKAA